MEPEIWLPVVGLEGLYEVSNAGRVRSLDRVIRQPYGRAPNPDLMVNRRLRGKVLVLQPTKLGYLQVVLPGVRTVLVQILVAETFLGPRPEGTHVLHWDDDGHHNSPGNLRYGTPQDNQDDAARNGKILRGERRHNATITDLQAAAIRQAPPSIRSAVLGRLFNLKASRVGEIRRRQRWRDAPDIDHETAAAALAEAELKYREKGAAR